MMNMALSTNWSFSTWFRVVGAPLLGIMVFAVIYFIDPKAAATGDYGGPAGWRYVCIDLAESIIGSIILSEAGIRLTQGLDRLLPWERLPLPRLLLQLAGLTLLCIAVIKLIVWFIILAEDPGYQYTDYDRLSIRQTIAVGSLMALFINAIYTGEYLLRRWKTALLEAEALKRESIEARFEVLRSQLDPHFLFNNLNTLTYLVEDNRPAVAFVENLSLVYRYILQNRDKTLVPLADELRLAEAYLALLKERFGEGIQVSIDIPAAHHNSQLPPMTLQLLLENAVKHNVVDSKQPLHISIRLNEASELVVENSLRRRKTTETSNGIGLQNIRHRYQLTASLQPTISENADHFVVCLPLI